MSKPDWKDAPEWAQWLAQNGDGEWYWHERQPVERSFVFDTIGGVWQFASAGPRNPAFYKTLERRP